jgi:hypothetical protein
MKTNLKKALTKLSLTKEDRLDVWLENGLIPRTEITPTKMVAGNEKKFKSVADANGVVYVWIGFGWMTTKDIYTNQPVVCDPKFLQVPSMK